MPRSIFINYRVSDSRTTAGRLAADLIRVFGDDAVFLDHTSLEKAEPYPEQLRARVTDASVVLVLIGSRWLAAKDAYERRRIDDPQDWVRQEIALALNGNAKVLPVLVNNAEPLKPPALAGLADVAPLADYQAQRLRDLDWESDFAALLVCLEALGFVQPTQRKPVADESSEPSKRSWSGNPYRGLAAFGVDDVPIFFGREQESDALLARIEANRVVAVIGASGAGKSSLVATGLLPRLNAHWQWRRLTPVEAGPP